MFKTLKSLLSDNKEALAEIAKIENSVGSVAEEITILEGKLSEAISKRDKYKNFVKQVKDKFKIEEGKELNEDTLNSVLSNIDKSKNQKLSEVEEILKLDISKLEKEVEKKELEIESLKNQTQQTVLETKLDLELYKTTSGIEAVNKKANDIIIGELKNGATIEDGKIVFKESDGTTLRKNGIPMSLSDKLEEIRSSEDYSFLFKSSVNSGSGYQSTNSINTNSNMSEFTRRKLEQARAEGLDIVL